MRFYDFVRSVSLETRPTFDLGKLEARYGQPLLQGRYWQCGEVPVDSAVLVLGWPDSKGEANITLVQRRLTLWTSPQRICLPGGGIKPGEDRRETILREVEEELKLRHYEYRIGCEFPGVSIGPYLRRRRIASFAGVAMRRPRFRPDGVEVARVIEVPLSEILRSGVRVRTFGLLHRTPARYFRLPGLWRGESIFGVTAMVLGALIECLGHNGKSCR